MSSTAAGRRWSLRWLVKHLRQQLLCCCHVIVTSLSQWQLRQSNCQNPKTALLSAGGPKWQLRQERCTLLLQQKRCTVLLQQKRCTLLLQHQRCTLLLHWILQALLPVCKLLQRLLLLLHPRRLRGLLLLLRRLLRRQLLLLLLRRTLQMLLHLQDIA